MTYKNGDIAVTQGGMRELLNMVSSAKDKTIEEEDVRGIDVNTYLGRIRRYKNSSHMIVIMGLKSMDIEDGAEQRLAHWVYVPYVNYKNSRSRALKVWTWGNEHIIGDFNNPGRDLISYKGLRSFAIRLY